MSPSAQARFIERAVARLRADPRIEAVLVAGAPLTQAEDEFSDVDLVLVCREDGYAQVMAERRQLAAGLGRLLAAFTGEHVGEPRLLICLYAEPLLHVDLKFITRAGLAERVETPRVAFDRTDAAAEALRTGTATWPARPPEWFEERFWIWVHYTAAKLARGELFETHDALACLRAQVLGPMLARNLGRRQRGVRRLEFEAPEHIAELAGTIARYDRADCWRALAAAVELYRRYREACPPAVPCRNAEESVTAFLREHGAGAT